MVNPVQRTILASRNTRTRGTRTQRFPLNAGPHGMLMVFRKYRYRTPGSRELLSLPQGRQDPNSSVAAESTVEINGSVLLPMPASIIDNTSVKLRSIDMASVLFGETAAQAGAAAVGNTSNIEDVLINESRFTPGAGITTAAGEAARSVALDAYYTLRRMADNQITQDLGAAAGQGAGITLNPRSALVFDGVNLKNYAFEWTLAPKNPEESDIIQGIISTLKRESLPSYVTGTTFQRVLFEYPSTVELYLLGVDPNYWIKFKECMLKSVGVNFTPSGGLSILKGGKPSAVSLTLQFDEMDIHTSEDYGGSAAAGENVGGIDIEGIGDITNILNITGGGETSTEGG